MTPCYTSATLWLCLMKQSAKRKILHFVWSVSWLFGGRTGMKIRWNCVQCGVSLCLIVDLQRLLVCLLQGLIVVALRDHNASTQTGKQYNCESYWWAFYLCKLGPRKVMPCSHVGWSFGDYKEEEFLKGGALAWGCCWQIFGRVRTTECHHGNDGTPQRQIWQNESQQ